MTDLHPDASPKKVRSYQRKRGQRFKGNHGGRRKGIEDQRTLLDIVWRKFNKLPKTG